MGDSAALEARIAALEAEIVSHRRAAMLIFLEYVARRPQERKHLIELLGDLVVLMGPEAAAISNALIEELEKGAPSMR
ncbi:hypothetical protein JJJ17_18370 [Paracoccus caeni]|uniref:Uncharacterized protein n=1 Tax=Paracoccus caeni TaxID=657651 RepID=A0A934SHF0_9RHOB|nr:hypothetical protein [Paracoccus caeni]MBK4217902.1 hypothetical protein [Paracoccus caeni]